MVTRVLYPSVTQYICHTFVIESCVNLFVAKNVPCILFALSHFRWYGVVWFWFVLVCFGWYQSEQVQGVFAQKQVNRKNKWCELLAPQFWMRKKKLQKKINYSVF